MDYTLHRIFMVFLWLLIIASQFADFPGWISLTLNLIGFICIVLHLAQFFVLRELIDSRGDGKVRSFIMTLLFGFMYWKSPIPGVNTETN